MPAVDQEQGIAAQQLKAAGPGDLGDAAVDGLLRDFSPALLLQAVQDRQGDGGVMQLHLPQQGEL